MSEQKQEKKNFLQKIYSDLPMNWLVVILYAIGTAVLTTIFLVVPVFEHTSFHRMGETFEAWIFFAVIIMANTKKPLESALKTFVFFLISQPLIYLFQVPFSSMGWQLFMYYKYWFIWTLLTVPMAFVGWYIHKKNWLSLLILFPILCLLMSDSIGGFQFAFKHFPREIVMAIFCLAQVIVYLYVFTDSMKKKIIGFVVPLAITLTLTLTTPPIEFKSNYFLPEGTVLTENAVLISDNTEDITVSLRETGKDSQIDIHAKDYGTTEFTIKDGDKTYRYTLEVYEDDNGHSQIRLTPIG